MSRAASLLRRFARAYFIAVGGGFTLATLAGIAANTPTMLRYHDESDVKYVREASFMLAFSILIVVAGIGIHKYRWWGLVMAAVMGIGTVLTGFANLISDPWDLHNFTVLLPMVLVLIWTCLPATWLEFKRQGVKVS